MAFVDASIDLVYVRGQDGSLLECVHNAMAAGDECWKKVEQTQEVGYDVSLGSTYHGKKPSPPGPAVEALDLVGHRYTESSVFMRYILLEDGSVWVWAYYGNPVSSFMLPLLGFLGWPVCGLVLAIGLTLAIWLVVGVRALVRHGKRIKEV